MGTAGLLRPRPVLAVLILVLVTVVALVGILWLAQRRLIYFPDRGSPTPPSDAREVGLHTADGLDLTAWLVPPTGPDRRIAVLVLPGNAGHRLSRMGLARDLARSRLTVLLLDYRGYGGNPGQPTEAGLALDARAGLAFLDTAGFGPDRTVYFGESLGGGVAAELATVHPPAGLVLRSPFLDLASVAAHHYPVLPVRALLRDRYPVAANVERVVVPTVVIYGGADTVVPAEQSQAVAQAAAGPVTTVVVAGADHNDPALAEGRQVIDAVVGLVDRLR